MKTKSKSAVLVCVLALAAAAAAQSPGGYQPGRRLLLDAHNAYPYQGQWSDRVDRALSTGTPLAVEQDLIWRPAMPGTAAHSIVSHGGPFTDNEPTLRDFLERVRPLVSRALTRARREDWPLITLNLDFKDSEPAHFAEIRALLSEYEQWLTTATRTASADRVEPLRLGPVLVLTGSDPAQQKAFHDAVPVGGTLLLFGAVTPAAPVQPTNYRRWSNNPWNVVEPKGQNGAGEWTADDAGRLGKTVRAAHEAGLRIRFYTLNGHSTERGERMGWTPGYNFKSLDAAQIRWRAAIAAGVDFIATDQYEEFAQISPP
jgi:glycerophosphoryl diester phosphodiesterase